MTTIISDAEWTTLANITEDTLVEMAADLSLLVPKVIDRRSLCESCVEAIVERARAEGLPFSKYDQEDLEALSEEERKALCILQGIRPTGDVRDIIKAGQKVYRFYQKNRPDNPTAMMIPSLLPSIARLAKATQSEGKAS